MKYDLSKLNYNEEIVNQLKEQHKELIEGIYSSKDDLKIDKNDTVTLYHGTSINSLNGILLNGILVRSEINISNFDKKVESNDKLIYMSNKWHYFYAHNAFKMNSKGKDDYFSLPCYLEAKIPKALLVEDEDFLHSPYVKNKIKRCIKRNDKYLEISWEESLAQYGTVAIIGNLDRSLIESFTILADLNLFYENFISPASQYHKELIKWGEGKGKGKLKFMDLVELEDSAKNITYWMKDFPKDHIITDMFMNESTDMLSLKVGRVVNEKEMD